MAEVDNQTSLQIIGQMISQLGDTWFRLAGIETSPTVDADAVITTGAGYLVNISIVDAGSGASALHNCQTVAAAADTNKLMVIPTTAEGVLPAGLNFNNGLVVVIGTGQKLNVTYTPSN